MSANTRKKNWGKGAIETISSQLRAELPGLRGFSATSMRNMRTFYEEWSLLERNSFATTNKTSGNSSNSSVATDEIQSLPANSSVTTDEFTEVNNNLAVATAEFAEDREIRQLQLANMPDFPLREFLSISFTHPHHSRRPPQRWPSFVKSLFVREKLMGDTRIPRRGAREKGGWRRE